MSNLTVAITISRNRERDILENHATTLRFFQITKAIFYLFCAASETIIQNDETKTDDATSERVEKITRKNRQTARASDYFIHLVRYSRRSRLKYCKASRLKIYLRKLRVAQQEDINANFNLTGTIRFDHDNFLDDEFL